MGGDYAIFLIVHTEYTSGSEERIGQIHYSTDNFTKSYEQVGYIQVG